MLGARPFFISLKMSSSAELGLLARLPSLASPLGIASIVVIGVIAIYVIEKLIGVPYPPDIPLIREPKGARRFSLRTRWAYLTDCQALFYEAYHEVHPPSPLNDHH